jgi:hypothetical protein
MHPRCIVQAELARVPANREWMCLSEMLQVILDRPLPFDASSARDQALVSHLAVLLSRLASTSIERHGTALDTIIDSGVVKLFVRVLLQQGGPTSTNSAPSPEETEAGPGGDTNRGSSKASSTAASARGGGGGGANDGAGDAGCVPKKAQEREQRPARASVKTQACVLHALSAFAQDYVRVVPKIVEAGALFAASAAAAAAAIAVVADIMIVVVMGITAGAQRSWARCHAISTADEQSVDSI